MTTNKHPADYVAYGCAVYSTDDWKDGVNRGGKIVASTCLSVIDPDSDDAEAMATDAECEMSARIARSLNTHEAMVQALQVCIRRFEWHGENLTRFPLDLTAMNRAKAALALATGNES